MPPIQKPVESALPPVPATSVPIAATAGSPAWVNPFLRRDPHDKARRLANSLVSDIIAYHPTEYAAARAAGTLPETFREEIHKSHADYVDQVGQALADSTPYFRDALNTILAAGQPLF